MFCMMTGTVLACSCSDERGIIWHAEAASPNGHYLARAETIQQGGPGNAWVSTEVRLMQGESDKGIEILILSYDDAPQPVPDAVSMTWDGDKTLHLKYSPSGHLDFQAVRASGVDIDTALRSR
jgi:hypothetical protein